MQCEAVLLGRAPSDGAIDAASLAALIRTFLLAKAFATRRYLIRCRDGLEFVPSRARRRRLDDEGFESDNDDDTSSTKSLGSDDTISNSSSCCFVDDHVFKTTGVGSVVLRTPVKSTSSVGTDSANSSGASDTDDLEGLNQESKSYVKTNGESLSKTIFQRSISEEGVETYPTHEVVFCHTDPQFPKVAVWVVKKPGSGLETLVFECKSSENLKKLCASFTELSRRSKLDQYTHTNRRKATTPSSSKASSVVSDSDTSSNTSTLKSSNAQTKSSTVTSTTTTPLSSVLVKSLGPQTLIKTQQQTIIRTLKNTTDAITKFSSKPAESTPSFPRIKQTTAAAAGKSQEVLPLRAIAKPHRTEEMPPMSRFNLVQRTDGDGMTHIEISRGIKDDRDVGAEDLNGPSSILSIHTPDVGNLLSTGEKNAPTKSRFTKEIESVIRSDVDACDQRKDIARQRQPAILVLSEDNDNSLRKVWNSPEDAKESNSQSTPPMRPERRRYIKKKSPAPEPPKQEGAKPAQMPSKINKDQDSLKIKGTQFESRKGTNQQKIVKGQFIRVSVDQSPMAVVPVIQQGAWGYANGNLLAYSPAPWSVNAAKNKSARRKSVDDIFTSSQKYHQQYQKPRSYRSKSPPSRPMAYRYIDTVPQASSSLSRRFFGVSQKLKEFGGAVVNSNTSRRRNSVGELAYAASQQNGGGNLKSVIKKGNKGRMGEYQEPKKVTFSAYATVQVVD